MFWDDFEMTLSKPWVNKIWYESKMTSWWLVIINNCMNIAYCSFWLLDSEKTDKLLWRFLFYLEMTLRLLRDDCNMTVMWLGTDWAITLKWLVKISYCLFYCLLSIHWIWDDWEITGNWLGDDCKMTKRWLVNPRSF